MRVRGVITRQGFDASLLLNEVAGEYADAYTGVLIAESGLNEQALREGVWPDYSAGLSQVIAANLGYGTFKQRADDAMLAKYQEYMFDPENAIREGWRYYKAALLRMAGDPLWAALSYNRGPSYTRDQLVDQVALQPEISRRFARYKAALQEAEKYRIMAESDGLAVSPQMREKLAAADDYPILDAAFVSIVGRPSEKAERVQGTKGVYIASPVDGWQLHGPFAIAE